MGIHKRSFVLDATYDFEVWNFPMFSYKYRYFNPQTWQESATPEAALVPYSRFTVDKFKEFRNPKTVSVIGIFMDVTLVKEMVPNQRSVDTTPPTKTLRLVYDLELDSDKNVIGGEWYQNAHPDFIWSYAKNTQAISKEDPALANVRWNKSQPIPEAFTSVAQQSSAQGVPLWSFLSKLAPKPKAAGPDDSEDLENPMSMAIGK
jgi:hypothetical protein